MKRILIVNNDEDTLSLLKKWLEKKEYDVKFTVDEDDVAGIIKDFIPHLLLIDILQVKILEEIRSLVKSSQIPVILMTGNTLDSHDRLLTIADDIIAKPFEPKTLEKKIRDILKTN